MINKAILVGRLGADPEVRYSPDGLMIVNFTLATSESYKDKSGEWVNKTEWHKIVIFGKRGEFAAKYLSKGMLVFVEGKIQTQQWQDKDGNKRYTTQINAANIQKLESSKTQQENTYENYPPVNEEGVPF